jgi:outer membrane receptor for ferrienterochelin and colicins
MSLARGAAAFVLLLTMTGRLVAQAPGVLSGRVVDAETRAGIAGAEVRIVGSASRTVSDTLGAWRIVGGGGPERVRIRRLGYAPREVTAHPGEPAVVTLEALAVALEAVVVTAARREQKLKDAVPETELLTRRDIARSGAGDVGAALTHATGIQLEGGVPAGAGVFLQGMGSQRVLVLLDGQPLVGRINGNFDLSRLPTSMIERIEVVRGPMSTLYGSDAMGGVVNVITRTPAEGRLDAGIAAIGGSQGRRDLSANLLGSRGAVGVALDLGLRSDALAPGLPGDDATYARRWSAAPKVRWQAAPGLALEASGLGIIERQRYRTGQLFHFADNDQWAARIGLVRQRGLRRFSATLSYTRFDHLSRASTGSQPASDSGARDVQQLTQAEVNYSAPVLGGLADAGLLLRHEAISADRVQGTARSLDGAEAFTQNTWSIGPLSLTPGVRLSLHQQWGTAFTPRVAALFRPSPGVAVRASAGAGYRAPDFKELYLDFVNAAAGYAVKGNPGLRPEHSTSVSAGVELVGDRLYARGSVYANWFRDFIDFGPQDASGTYTYGNIARGTTRGTELEAGANVGRLRLDAGYAFLDARDQVTGQPLLGRAPHSGRLGGTLALGTARLTTTVLVTGRTPTSADSAGRITGWRDTFVRLDIRTAAPLAHGVALMAGAENLLDRRLGDAWPGFTGRRVYAGLSWSAAAAPLW